MNRNQTNVGGLPSSIRSAVLLALAMFLAPSLGAAQKGGVWEPPFPWPIVAVHLLHHPSGEILTWAYDGPSAHLWNPSTNVFTPVPNFNTNIFCSGHADFGKGRYVVGGGFFVNSTQIFDDGVPPGTWRTLEDMNSTRFYPTLTTLPDGRILATSGLDDIYGLVTTPEVWSPATESWEPLKDAQLQVELYPFMFLLPKGLVFFAGPGTSTYVLDVDAQSWSFVANSVNDGGSAVSLSPGRILKAGSYAGTSSTTEIIDFNLPSAPAWVTVGPMKNARHDLNLTLLPDGSVLATGGHDEFGQPVLAAEIFLPDELAWKELNSMEVPRQYHSTAQLLRDGRVVSAGGDGYPSAEIFNPPYLFQGSRPPITSAPDGIGYAEVFKVGTSAPDRIKRVTLLRLGAVTHSFDQNQRFIELKFTTLSPSTSRTIQVHSPARATLAPPGAYLLFLLSDEGVPSRGHYLLLN